MDREELHHPPPRTPLFRLCRESMAAVPEGGPAEGEALAVCLSRATDGNTPDADGGSGSKFEYPERGVQTDLHTGVDRAEDTRHRAPESGLCWNVVLCQRVRPASHQTGKRGE